MNFNAPPMIVRGLLLSALWLTAELAHAQPASPSAPSREKSRSSELGRPKVELISSEEAFASEKEIEPGGTPYEEVETAQPVAPPGKPKARRKVPAPSDPQPADWGNIDQARETPVFTPSVNYLLVRPAKEVVQPEWGYGFQQAVTAPDETYHHGPIPYTGVSLERPDGLAPIGVIGDHTLEAGGQFFVSYRFNNISYSDMLDGTDTVSPAEAYNNYTYALTKGQAQRHMLLMEYAPTDDLTILALLPYLDTTIDQVPFGGSNVRSSNTDPGDITLQALYVLWRGERQQLHLNLGLQLPLGVDDADRNPPTPTSPGQSYPLRTTSGTYDFMPGATYRWQNDDWTWGVQSTGMIRFGINNDSYKLGNRFNITTWLARRLTENFSLSARLDTNIWGNIFGADPRLNQSLVPTNDPQAQGGRRIDFLFGANLYLPNEGYWPTQWISVEGGIPVYQYLFGPQLEADWMLTAGWNIRF